MEKRISDPTFSSRSSSRSTPLAETLRVWAGNSDLPMFNTTGSARGKRTAQRTSCRKFAGMVDGTSTSDFIAFMLCTLTKLGLNRHSSGLFAFYTRHESLKWGNHLQNRRFTIQIPERNQSPLKTLPDTRFQ